MADDAETRDSWVTTTHFSGVSNATPEVKGNGGTQRPSFLLKQENNSTSLTLVREDMGKL